MNLTEWAVVGLILLAIAAMNCLCLTMKRHRHALRKTNGSVMLGARTLRILGWALVILNTGFAINLFGWGIGPVVVFGCLSLGALVTLGLASWQVRWLIQVGGASTVLGVIATLT